MASLRGLAHLTGKNGRLHTCITLLLVVWLSATPRPCCWPDLFGSWGKNIEAHQPSHLPHPATLHPLCCQRWSVLFHCIVMVGNISHSIFFIISDAYSMWNGRYRRLCWAITSGLTHQSGWCWSCPVAANPSCLESMYNSKRSFSHIHDVNGNTPSCTR